MAERRRQTNRRIVIRLVGREPSDAAELLKAVEDAFRPKHVEISVEQSSDPQLLDCADEKLEVHVRDLVAKALDEVNEARSKEENKEDEGKAAALKTSIRAWIAEKLLLGWKVIANVVPVLDKLWNLVS